MLHTRRRAVRIVAVAAVAVAAFVVTAVAGTAAESGGVGHALREAQNIADEYPVLTPEQEYDELVGLVVDGAPFEARTKTWTQTGVGASIAQDNGSLFLVAAMKNSLDGDGATVSTVTLNGSKGTDTATRYMTNGVQKFEEEFTLGAADANGLITFTGTGKCTGPGTGVHKHEKCRYTYEGTLDPETSVVHFKVTGTIARWKR
jgi:hypothetical protein